MGREALSTEVWLQGTCSDVQLHRLSYLRPRRARAGGQRELSICFCCLGSKYLLEPPRYDALLCIHEQAIPTGNLISLQCAFQR